MNDEKTSLFRIALRSILEINDHSIESAVKLAELALNKSLKITASKYGYIYYYDENTEKLTLYSWSHGVMKDCTIASPLTTYDLSKTGVWGDAIRFRKPIIINDYKDCITKKGYPAGHVVLKNFLTIPVFRNNKIVALSGVANKDSDYTAEDIENLTAFLNHVWGTFEKLDLVEQLKSYTTDLEKIIEDKIVKYKKINLLLKNKIDKRKKLLSAVHESNRAMTIVLDELNTCVAIISLDTKKKLN